jgi:hypothetical protein
MKTNIQETVLVIFKFYFIGVNRECLKIDILTSEVLNTECTVSAWNI